MELFVYTLLGLLAALACCDLFVGVSNDASNFLNSAVGSRTAPFWVILAVASVGVILGATFSSGMMEIAKTGVFVPEMLSFKEVMVIFCAVMVTDVLLLNTFNSLGLPTSTTVSIVFELLGGTIAVACWKIWANGYPLTDLGLYVNSGKALAMIMGILASVLPSTAVYFQLRENLPVAGRHVGRHCTHLHSLLPGGEGRTRCKLHAAGMD